MTRRYWEHSFVVVFYEPEESDYRKYSLGCFCPRLTKENHASLSWFVNEMFANPDSSKLWGKKPVGSTNKKHGEVICIWLWLKPGGCYEPNFLTDSINGSN